MMTVCRGGEIRARVGDDPERRRVARMRLIVWCWDCRHQVEPDAAEMAEHYGAEATVPDWRF
jgi:hypothetical protein